MKLEVVSALLVESYNFSATECTSVNSGKLRDAKIYSVPEGLLVEYRGTHLIPYANVKGMTLKEAYDKISNETSTQTSEVSSSKKNR